MKTQTKNLARTASSRKSIRENVLEKLRNQPLCSFEIQMLCGYDTLITVSRRMVELENDGKIVRTGTICEYKGMQYDQYEVAKPGTEEENRQKRHGQRNIEWLNQGVNLGYISNKQRIILKADLIKEMLGFESNNENSGIRIKGGDKFGIGI